MFFKAFTVVLLAAAATGCSTYAVPRYAASAETVSALRQLKVGKVSVGKFATTTKTGNEITCRAVGPIKTPDGESFEEYVRKALVSELLMADLHDIRSPLILTGVLNQLDFDSMNGQWTLGLDLKSSNGRALSVKESYSFVSSFYGETGCNQTAQAALGAVQNLISKAVADPAFKELVRQ